MGLRISGGWPRPLKWSQHLCKNPNWHELLLTWISMDFLIWSWYWIRGTFHAVEPIPKLVRNGAYTCTKSSSPNHDSLLGVVSVTNKVCNPIIPSYNECIQYIDVYCDYSCEVRYTYNWNVNKPNENMKKAFHEKAGPFDLCTGFTVRRRRAHPGGASAPLWATWAVPHGLRGVAHGNLERFVHINLGWPWIFVVVQYQSITPVRWRELRQ